MESSTEVFSAVDRPIVWIDMEMTGLDVNIEKIIEIGVVLTDNDLRKIVKGLNIIV